MNKLKIAHLNVRSLVPHINELEDIVISESVNVMAVGETWLHNGIHSSLVQINGFEFIRRDYDGRGSGVGLYVSKSIRYDRIPTSFNIEHLCVKLTLFSINIIVCVVYRRHSQNYNIFLDEVENLVTTCYLMCENIVLLGDTNLDLFKTQTPAIKSYDILLNSLGLTQLIINPTRCKALLDHILVSNTDLVSDSGTISKDLSDHDVIYVILNIYRKRSAHTFITYRNFLCPCGESAVQQCLQSSNIESIFYIDNIDMKVKIFNEANRYS